MNAPVSGWRAQMGSLTMPRPPSHSRSMGAYMSGTSSGARSSIASWIVTADATREWPPAAATRTPSSEMTSQRSVWRRK